MTTSGPVHFSTEQIRKYQSIFIKLLCNELTVIGLSEYFKKTDGSHDLDELHNFELFFKQLFCSLDQLAMELKLSNIHLTNSSSNAHRETFISCLIEAFNNIEMNGSKLFVEMPPESKRAYIEMRYLGAKHSIYSNFETPTAAAPKAAAPKAAAPKAAAPKAAVPKAAAPKAAAPKAAAPKAAAPKPAAPKPAAPYSAIPKSAAKPSSPVDDDRPLPAIPTAKPLSFSYIPKPTPLSALAASASSPSFHPKASAVAIVKSPNLTFPSSKPMAQSLANAAMEHRLVKPSARSQAQTLDNGSSPKPNDSRAKP